MVIPRPPAAVCARLLADAMGLPLAPDLLVLLAYLAERLPPEVEVKVRKLGCED